MLTCYVVPHDGKFYLFYTGVNEKGGGEKRILYAVADRPEGPWVRPEKNLIFESNNIDGWEGVGPDDVNLLLREGKWWLYYKGRSKDCKRWQDTQIGVAFAKDLTGPYVRWKGNPIGYGHAFALWKQGDGVAALMSNGRDRKVHWAADGLHFTPYGPMGGATPGVYCPDNFKNGFSRGIRWGIDTSYGAQYLDKIADKYEGGKMPKKNRIQDRFDCDLWLGDQSEPVATGEAENEAVPINDEEEAPIPFEPITPARGAAAERQVMEMVRISDDGKGFVLADSNAPFVPWGFNFIGEFGRVFDEYWEDDWAGVEEDFRYMQKLDANAVRVYMQFGTYMKTAEEVDPAAIKRLQRLLDLAQDCGLRLDLVGLGCYRLKRIPPWYDKLSEADRWKAQARFWEAIAKACAGHPAVFCYDLMNEPVITRPKEGEHPWVLGELVGLYFTQRICNDPGDRDSRDIAEAWVKKMTGAIRKHDPDRLITVGAIPWALTFPKAKPLFYSPRVARHLDFVEVHFYPKSGEIEKAIKAVAVYDIGKPLVIGETFPLNCTVKEIDQFVNGVSPLVDGWMSHYFGTSIEEHAAGAKPGGKMVAEFLKYWQEKGRR